MRRVSSLTVIADRARDFFTKYATVGTYGTIVLTGAGTAAITAGASQPRSDYDVLVEFTAGGTVGESGIEYRESLNNGKDWLSSKKPLGIATSIPVFTANTGVVLELGSGTIISGQTVAVPTEGPRRTAPILVGWKESFKQINQGPGGANRIVLTPGDDSGRDGVLVNTQRTGPRDMLLPPPDNTTAAVGMRTRSIADWQRVIVCSIWGVDPGQPGNDEANIGATERLFEDLQQAMQASASGLFQWSGPPIWTLPKEQQFGKEIRIPMTLRSTFLDLDFETVTPDAAIQRGSNP